MNNNPNKTPKQRQKNALTVIRDQRREEPMETKQ